MMIQYTTTALVLTYEMVSPIAVPHPLQAPVCVCVCLPACLPVCLSLSHTFLTRQRAACMGHKCTQMPQRMPLRGEHAHFRALVSAIPAPPLLKCLRVLLNVC